MVDDEAVAVLPDAQPGLGYGRGYRYPKKPVLKPEPGATPSRLRAPFIDSVTQPLPRQIRDDDIERIGVRASLSCAASSPEQMLHLPAYRWRQCIYTEHQCDFANDSSLTKYVFDRDLHSATKKEAPDLAGAFARNDHFNTIQRHFQWSLKTW